MTKRIVNYRTRMMLRAASTRATYTHTIGGQKKTVNAPRPITLARKADGYIHTT